MNRNYVIYSFILHLSLLVIAVIVTQLSQVTKTPKYQKVTIRSVGSGVGTKTGKNVVNNTNVKSTKEKITKEAPKKAEKPVEKVKEAPKKEAKQPPKKVKENTAKEKTQKTPKTLQKEVGKDNTSRNSKNASLLEDALASINQEVESSRNNGAVAKAIADLEASDATPAGSEDYGTYVDIVGTILKNQWFYPNLGRDEKLRTTVRIFVDGTGKIIDYRIERSSGREDFDASALRSIQQYSHFPIPPNRKSVDFVVNFNLLEE